MKIDMFMDNFVGIIQNLNEKKEILTQAYPNKAIEVKSRLSRKMFLKLGKYTLQKNAGYIVARNV